LTLGCRQAQLVVGSVACCSCWTFGLRLLSACTLLGCGVSRHVTDVHAVLVGTATVISSLDEILNVLNASPDLCRWAMEESA